MTKLEKFFWLSNRDYGIGIPQIVFARYVGCDVSTLSRIINGKQTLSDSMLKKIEQSVDEIYADIKKVMEKEEQNDF